MAKFILMVESDCVDTKKENDFNDWYNNMHIPDILGTKGFVKATRYELTQPVEGRSKYVAIYEIEADNLDTVMAKHQDNMRQKRQQGRFSDLINATSRAVYKQVYCSE